MVWALGLLLQLPHQTKFIAAYFVGTSGVRLVWEAFTLSGITYHFPEFYAIPIPFLYLIGPSILLYYEKLGGEGEWKLDYRHFIPVFMSFLPFLIWIPLDVGQKQSAIHSLLQGNWEFPNSIFILWVLGPKISILAYTLFIGFRKSREGFFAIRSLPERIQLFSHFLMYYILLMILADIFGYVLGIEKLYRLSAWSHSIAAILVYLYSRYNPHSMLEISEAIQKARYSQSKLMGVQTNQLVSKLNDLMTKESYFADEDLRLSTLAEALEINPHQLSELINVHFKMSFIQFVNGHRIQIACQMLEEEERNILSIAYAVGFNSKSAFNRVFKELVGTAPREYRKQPNQFESQKSQLFQKIHPKL